MSETLNEVLRGQRNDAYDALAVVTDDLAIEKRVTEKLDKIIADSRDKAAKKHLALNHAISEIERLEGELEDLRVTPIESPKLIEAKQIISNQNDDISLLNDELSELTVNIESGKDEITRLHSVVGTSNKQNREQAETIAQLKTLNTKQSHTITELGYKGTSQSNKILDLQARSKQAIENHTKSQLHNEGVIRDLRVALEAEISMVNRLNNTITKLKTDLKKANCFANGQPKNESVVNPNDYIL